MNLVLTYKASYENYQHKKLAMIMKKDGGMFYNI